MLRAIFFVASWACYFVTFTVTVVVWVWPPPAAVMVMVWLPNPAFLDAVIVIVELPEPDAILEGLNDTVRPPPAEPVSDTLELNPFTGAIATVLVVVPLRRTEAGADADKVKSGAGAVELTVRDTVVLCTVDPLVPVIVMA